MIERMRWATAMMTGELLEVACTVDFHSIPMDGGVQRLRVTGLHADHLLRVNPPHLFRWEGDLIHEDELVLVEGTVDFQIGAGWIRTPDGKAYNFTF